MIDYSDYREKLNNNGFVQFHSVFNDKDLKIIEHKLDKIFNFSTENTKNSLKADGVVQEIHRTVRSEPQLRLSEVFLRCRNIASALLNTTAHYSYDHAIYKFPGHESNIGWHQDQAYQTKDLNMRSIHFWIPLQHTDARNGTLEFIFGSHKSPLLQHKKVKNSNTLEAVIEESEVEISRNDINKGNMTAHLPNTLHRSGNNLSDTVRKAWILHFSPYGKLDMLRPTNIVTHIKRILAK